MAAGKNSSDSPKKSLGKAKAAAPDRNLDQALRPEKFDNFVGQARTVERLKSNGGSGPP
jgi:Holliday junction resolvasome RuvABC ATP-dependent DNA helicase subunit